ncbi:phytoene/squalene synthase family protein [Streptomyces melanogenes]|uniref:Squalene/phytoene synthase family protein n=1 Tax=Streptomyces melanogenes TaxID=67326 RepID=A0ABZ1XWD0_9ACTN|nr:squalene/phytoene synthase family protein [Streptomyces melanogenes]
MTTRWSRTLDHAGIDDPALRGAYSGQRKLVARFARAEYTAVRLLLPPRLIPHIVAATAFMHHTDNLIDQGPVKDRLAAADDWRRQVTTSLADGSSDDPLLRALTHTISRYPQLQQYVRQFLSGADTEVEWESFSGEADFQDYVTAYSLPAFMLVACLLAPEAPDAAYVTGCRAFIEATQRLDFLDDIAEDLAEGRTGITHETLARHGLTPQDLRNRRTLGFEALLHEQTALVRTGLEDSRSLEPHVHPSSRPLVHALIDLQTLRVGAVRKAGRALLDGSTRPPLGGALRVLGREYRAARRQG